MEAKPIFQETPYSLSEAAMHKKVGDRLGSSFTKRAKAATRLTVASQPICRPKPVLQSQPCKVFSLGGGGKQTKPISSCRWRQPQGIVLCRLTLRNIGRCLIDSKQ